MEEEDNCLKDNDDIKFQTFITMEEHMQYGELGSYNFFHEPYMHPFQVTPHVPLINAFNPIFNMSGVLPVPLPMPVYPDNTNYFNSNLSMPLPGAINIPYENRCVEEIKSNSHNEDMILDLFKDLNLNIEEDDFTSEKNRAIENKVNNILSKIEHEESSILNVLTAYKIPYAIARLLTARIVKMTLVYENNGCK